MVFGRNIFIALESPCIKVLNEPLVNKREEIEDAADSRREPRERISGV